MKQNKSILVILLVSILTCSAQDQTPKAMAESFFQSLKKGETEVAYNQLFVGSTIPESKPQAVGMLKRQTESALPMYGEIIGSELISEEKFGDSVVRLVYVLKLEKHPVGWEFFFYKPKSKWFLSNVIFNDQFRVFANMK
jgi:hypothetical protein